MNIDLYNSECLCLMKSFENEKFNLILTDPPYFNSDKTRANWDKNFCVEKFWQEMNRLIHPKGSIIIFGNEPFSSLMRTTSLVPYKYDLKWVKNRQTGFANANYRPMNRYEDIMVFSKANASSGGKKNPMIYNPQGLIEINKKKKNSSKRHGSIMNRTNNTGAENSLLIEGSEYIQKFTNYPSNVLFFDCDTTHFHPTQKPVALLEYLIKTYSNENDSVLDCFMGSGSTGIACINTKRKFTGIEIDEEYFNVAKERISKIMIEY